MNTYRFAPYCTLQYNYLNHYIQAYNKLYLMHK
jgi:hypothetical protein